MERYKNMSGKYVQMPNRLSSEFKWQPGEIVEIKEILPNGYILHNLDYCGIERCFETSFITNELFGRTFTIITNNTN